MILGLITSIAEVVGAFLGGEGTEEFADRDAYGFDSSRGGFSQQMFELGEDLFDRVQVGGVFWQEEELGAGGADERPHRLAFVATEIVHDDDVTFAQRGQEDLLDIGSKALAVDRPLKQPRCIDAVMAQGGQEGRGLPVAVRDLGDETLAAWRPSPQRRHVGLGPGLVNEDQAFRLDATLILCPLRPSARDVGTIAFPSHHAFF